LPPGPYLHSSRATAWGDLYRIYAVTKRDGIAFNLAYIDDDFAEPHPDQLDLAYMNWRT
jgi:hypothetical protein